MTTSYLNNGHLLLSVIKSSGDKPVAELFLSLGTIRVEQSVNTSFTFPLCARPRSKRVLISPLYVVLFSFHCSTQALDHLLRSGTIVGGFFSSGILTVCPNHFRLCMEH